MSVVSFIATMRPPRRLKPAPTAKDIEDGLGRLAIVGEEQLAGGFPGNQAAVFIDAQHLLPVFSLHQPERVRAEC